MKRTMRNAKRSRKDKPGLKMTKKLSEGIKKKLEDAENWVYQAKTCSNSDKKAELLNNAIKLYNSCISEM